MRSLRDVAAARGVALLFGVDHARVVARLPTAAFHDPVLMSRAVRAAHGAYGHDLVVVHSDAFVSIEAAGGRLAFPDRGPPVLTARPVGVPDRPLDPWHDGRLPVLLEAACLVQRCLEGSAETAVSLTGPFALAAAVLGESAALRAVPFTEASTRVLMEWAEASVCSAVRAAADEGLGVMVAEPLAALMSRQDFTHTVAPSLCRTLACGGGIVHICGDSSHLLPILPSLGGSAFSLDRVDLTKASLLLRDCAALLGGPSSDRIRAGPPAPVFAAANEYTMVEGTFIPCNGCDLAWDTPVAHVQAFVHGAREARARPHRREHDDTVGKPGRSPDPRSLGMP